MCSRYTADFFQVGVAIYYDKLWGAHIPFIARKLYVFQTGTIKRKKLMVYKPYFLFKRRGNISWRIIRVEDKQPLSPMGRTIAVSYPYFTIIVHKKISVPVSV